MTPDATPEAAMTDAINETSDTDAAAVFARLATQVDHIDRKLSALIEVIGIIDTRGGENAAILAEVVNRVGTSHTPERSAQTVAALVAKQLSPAIHQLTELTRRCETNVLSVSQIQQSGKRQTVALCVSAAAIISVVSVMAWMTITGRAHVQSPLAARSVACPVTVPSRPQHISEPPRASAPATATGYESVFGTRSVNGYAR
jgi:hypothetical protein